MAAASTILAPENELSKSAKKRSARPSRKRRWAVAAMGLLLVYFSPAIFAITPLRDLPLRMVFEGIEGTIHSGSASLGWFLPVTYRDVEIVDRDGEALVSVPEVNLERTALQLLINRADVGKVVLVKPALNIAAGQQTTNAEEVMLPWWNMPSSGPVQLELQVVDGSLRLHDRPVNKTWDVSELQASLSVNKDGDLSSWSIDGKFGAAGAIAAHKTDGPKGATEIVADGVPLAICRFLAARVQPAIKLAGELSCDLAWAPANDDHDNPAENEQAGKDTSRLHGKVGLTNLVLGAPSLRGDELRLNDLEVESDVEIANGTIRVKQLVGDCEVARLTLRGEFPASGSENDPALGLAHSSFELNGSIQLARLAEILPHALRVRSDIQLTDGEIRCTLSSARLDSGHTWQGRLEASGLAATRAGQTIQWEKPLLVNVSARESSGALRLEALECASDFLYVTARGTADELAAEATFDLDRLKGELGRFFDLETVALAGEGKLQMRWKRAAQGGFQASGAGTLQNLRLGAARGLLWQEQDLSVEFEAAGRWSGAADDPLESAVLKLAMGERSGARDELTIHLREPVALPSGTKNTGIERLPVLIHCTGNLKQWRQRLLPWIELAGWELAGGVDLHANVTWTPDAFELHSLKGGIQQLHAANGEWLIEEPLVNIEAAGRYDNASSRVALTTAKLESSAASVQIEQAAIALAGSGSRELAGRLNFIADLQRLQRWTQDARQPAAIAWSGQMRGAAKLRQGEGTTSADVECLIDNFAAAAGSSPQSPVSVNPLRGAGGAAVGRAPFWQEKQLSLALSGSYSSESDALVLSKAEVRAEALAIGAAGRIDRLSGTADTEVTGDVRYDWQKLSPLLAPYAGQDVRVMGQDHRQFSVRGPIAGLLRPGLVAVAGAAREPSADALAWLKPMSAQASIGWETAEAYGMRIGRGDVSAELRDSLIRFKPIELAVSEGRITLTPLIRLTPVPVVEHGRGKLIDRVRVSPEMASTWLKYIAPAVADATQTEGTLSLELEGAQAPLAQPAKATLAGSLDVHSLQVTPGAPARSLVLLAEQIRALVERRPPPMELSRNPTLLSVSDQKIDFRMAQGRVYHQGMAMNVGPITLRTQGWVALDESIGLVIEIPVKAEWFGRGQPPPGLKDQTLRIPMAGTLRQPQIDRRAWQQVAVLFGQNAAREVIEDQLNKQIDRLLQPR